MSTAEYPGEEFLCQCGTEALRVWVPDDEDDLVYLSMWRDPYQHSPVSWRHRLRLIWRIARRGEPFGDQLTLSRDDADRLARRLLARFHPPTITVTASNGTLTRVATTDRPA